MTGIVIFRDEQGNTGTYRFAGDESGDTWVSVCERACKRLGLVDSAEERLRWPAIKASAEKRAKEYQARK